MKCYKKNLITKLCRNLLKNIDIAINSKEVRFNSNYKLAVARKSKLKKDKNEVTLKERARQCYQCIRKVFHVIHRPFYLRKLNKIKPSKNMYL